MWLSLTSWREVYSHYEGVIKEIYSEEIHREGIYIEEIYHLYQHFHNPIKDCHLWLEADTEPAMKTLQTQSLMKLLTHLIILIFRS